MNRHLEFHRLTLQVDSQQRQQQQQQQQQQQRRQQQLSFYYRSNSKFEPTCSEPKNALLALIKKDSE